ncbi:TetR/AcrR family transcriptional regulator [Aeromicrobium chenweiae]|uniref:TetR family transcriptional regulator n=1 Tax=Aeromicrobium chenweiae TaxID=2079793 RepID=A0A2S0WNT3_9ACTN|nr:TetR/AcrR family transcriptional regulator [Aeromicrobium chenweiae]AWB92971.1 TetR family transcriptional regulator [Aeromicrobium chenweiae]TGN33965.1 TetR/AcrR family transcriptional regulator [Aeromicrobium chenweiae]
MPDHQVVRGVRTGGRSARVREAVLNAAFSELVESGYAGLSVESVATRAQVNKTTIYRRWSTLDNLLVDALTTWSDDVPAVDTGSIESDLLALGGHLGRIFNYGPGRQVAAFVLTAGLEGGELREAARRYFDHQTERVLPTVERAIARGEIPADCDPLALLDTFRAPLAYRLVTAGEPVDADLIARATGITLAAARAGLLST